MSDGMGAGVSARVGEWIRGVCVSDEAGEWVKGQECEQWHG